MTEHCYIFSFSSDVNPPSLVLRAFLRGREAPSRLKVRKEVKQGERVDQGHRVRKWWNLNPRHTGAKAQSHLLAGESDVSC